MLKKLENENFLMFSKNVYDDVPDEFHCEDRLKITCTLHGQFEQKAFSHWQGSEGCKPCSIIKTANSRRRTNEDFANESRALYGDKFDYSEAVYTHKDTHLILGCPIHGKIHVKPSQHYVIKGGCSQCSKEIFLEERREAIFDRWEKMHGDRYDYSKVEYKAANDKVEIICQKHGSFWMEPIAHAEGSGCRECAIENGRGSTEKFIRKARLVHGDKYGYDKVDYKLIADHVIITCPIHGDWTQRPSSHLLGNGCWDCSVNESRKSTDEFIHDSKLVHGDRFDYSKTVYINSKTLITLICREHGEFRIYPNGHLSNGQGCQKCKESKGEREVSMLLDKYGITFIREYKILPHLFRYDFFLPDHDILIEYHGHQHYRVVELFGGVEGYEKRKRNDSIKVHNAKVAGLDLLVLNYKHREGNILEPTLIKLLKHYRPWWFICNGKIMSFKKSSSVFTYFSIPNRILVRDLYDYVCNNRSDVKKLF